MFSEFGQQLSNTDIVVKVPHIECDMGMILIDLWLLNNQVYEEGEEIMLFLVVCVCEGERERYENLLL